MNLRDKIKSRLEKQQEIEGKSEEIDLLLRVLDLAETEAEWDALTTVTHHRYGPMSYEVHVFYHPSRLLTGLRSVFSVGSE